jgi:hypothetical protein
MPILAPILGEEILLIVGLLGGCTHVIVFHQDLYLIINQHISTFLD